MAIGIRIIRKHGYRRYDFWRAFADDTIIIMTADHGGIKTGHGGKTLREMEIPFIISGKNVRKGMEIKESMMQYDTAAMIAYILGLKQPQSWIGRPVKTVFK